VLSDDGTHLSLSTNLYPEFRITPQNQQPTTKPIAVTKPKKTNTMSKKNTTTTIVPAASTRAVTPKPTKSEVIEALTRLKIEEIKAENDVREAAIAAQQEVVKKLALQHIDTSWAKFPDTFSVENANVSTGGNESHVEFTIRISTKPKDSYTYDNPLLIAAPTELKQALDKLEKLPRARHLYSYSRKEIQKEIRQSLTQDAAGRVTRLLEDSESRAALSDLLKVVESGIEKRVN
jgi:hypothetical protein